jgi:excisionase family DNA binding protein
VNDSLAVTLTVDQLDAMIRKAVREEVTTREADIMTRTDVAKLLKVAERTVVTYVEKQKLPAVKLPNGWRFFRADVVAWMKGRQ